MVTVYVAHDFDNTQTCVIIDTGDTDTTQITLNEYVTASEVLERLGNNVELVDVDTGVV